MFSKHEKKILITSFIFLFIVAILIFLMMLTYDIKQKEMKQKNFIERNKEEVISYPKVEIEVRK